MVDVEWMDAKLACRNDPELFTEPKDKNDLHNAIRICKACPVRDQCLEYAVTLPCGPTTGVWGGYSWATIKDIRARRNKHRLPVKQLEMCSSCGHVAGCTPECDECEEYRIEERVYR